jgi:hypothetical protein
VSRPLRKYHTAAGLSTASEQRLLLLEQRFEQLEHELGTVEAAIERRFPLLGIGLGELHAREQPPENQTTSFVKIGRQIRRKPR